MNCDYLVIGGGSAGAIIARRLADAQIGKVILLEAGMNDEGKSALQELSLLDQQGDETEWGFLAKPVANKNNQIDYARAKMLGGCGNHNDCAFLVPPDCDFDRWHDLGAKGWNARSLKPYSDKIDNRVWVETSPPVNPISQKFMDAGIELGLEQVNFRQQIRSAVGAFPLNCRGDLRQSSSVCYLHPVDSLPDNISILFNTRVTEIIFNGTRATGCQTNQGEIIANKEVIVTAGAIQTPQLLMVSGIGISEDLKKLEIRPKVNLEGVGANLVDHASANVVLSLKDSLPPWQLTCCEVTAMLQLDEKEPAPDLLYHFVLGVRDKYEGRESSYPNSVKISPNVTRPRSRGNITLTTADINEHPVINLNYFSDPENYDLEKLIRGIRYSRKLATTQAFNDLVDMEQLPGNAVQSDQEIADYILDTCETVYHPSGTCRMGEDSDPTSVVTPDLKVKGITGLRVCDASVFPDMVTVNINNTVMMIAEKAADLIITANPKT